MVMCNTSDSQQEDKQLFVCLNVCFESHELYFSYLATVTITGDKAANLDLTVTQLTLPWQYRS
jgi:hypothetical protein